MSRRAKENQNCELHAGEALHAVVVPSEDAPKAVLLTTAEAARVAGVSESTIVRNRERLGAVRDGRAFYFREEVLRERSTTILKRRSVVIAQEKSDGDVAAAVFQALEDGQNVAQIVIALHVPPETVMNLKDQWDASYERKRFDPLLRCYVPVSPAAGRSTCRCGSGRVATHCTQCVLSISHLEADRRTENGCEQVRLTGQATTGYDSVSLGRFSTDWRDLESDDGASIERMVRNDARR